MKIKALLQEIWYTVYKRGIRRLIPSYCGRTIFTSFFWRTLKDRIVKGFDETALWSLDWHLTKLIAPRIKAFTEAFISCPFSLPGQFLEDEYQKSVAKGYKWNSRWHRMEDKRENKRCWKRATNAWIAILCQIRDGFDDMKLEGENWDKWNAKWEPEVNKFNKKLDKAKTEKEKAKLWETLHTFRKYRAGVRACVDDVTYELHQNAKNLLAEYYDHLWS